MDPEDIHRLPDEVAGVFDAAAQQRLAELEHQMGTDVGDLARFQATDHGLHEWLVTPPDRDANGIKMNRHARRQWCKVQRGRNVPRFAKGTHKKKR